MLAIDQNVKSFITIKPEELIFAGLVLSCWELKTLPVETQRFSLDPLGK